MDPRRLGNRVFRPVARTPIDSRGFLASVAKADRGYLSMSEFNKLKMRAETRIDTKFTMMKKSKQKIWIH